MKPVIFPGKIILLSFLTLALTLTLNCQIPQGFNYQAIAKEAGTAVADKIIKVKLSVMSDTLGFRAGTGGVYVWEEEHTNVKTNSFGMFTIVLGSTSASKVQGSAATFSAIDWSVANLYVGTKIANPTTYTVMGAAKLWSVPYALRSQESGQWTTSGSNIYRLTGNVGLGTTNPLSKLSFGNYFINNTAPSSAEQTSTIRLYDVGDGSVTYGLGVSTNSLNIAANQSTGTIRFYTNALERLRVDASGKIGIGTSTPTALLTTYGTLGDALGNSSEIVNLTSKPTSNTDFLRFYSYRKVAGTTWNDVAYRIQHRVDATDMAFIEFNPGSAGRDLAFGTNNIERVRINYDGNVGIGTTTPSSKMVIQPSATWDDNTPLFEVKNKYGFPVLAVYNNGVRILVEDTDGKGAKGGFAVGGFDPTKAGETVNLMTVSADSVRFNIDNNTAKAAKGGFAVGSFDNTKAVSSKAFMHLTPQSSDDGQYNTFIGFGSGKYNTSGIKNAFIGYNAGLYNRTGNQNVIIGTGRVWSGSPVLTPTDLGSYNTFVGYQAGGYCKGLENTAVGNNSGYSLTLNTSYNSFFGRSSGEKFNNGVGNVFLGNYAGFNQTSGNNNTYVGAVTGYDNISGSNNIFIGIDAGSQITGSNNIVIGTNSATTSPAIGASNNLLIGPIITGIPFICGNMSAYMLGIGRVPTSVTFEVGGEASKATSGGWLANSDSRIKRNIEDIENAMELIQKLHPVKFRYSDEWLKRYPVIEDKVYYNFIAQEYKEVFPESVIGSGEYLNGQADEILQMDSYNAQIVAIKAVQDLIAENSEQKRLIDNQAEQIKRQEDSINELKDRLSKLEAAVSLQLGLKEK